MTSAHILLVEDNEGDILLTREAFEESKVSISLDVARNGREALDFLYKRNNFSNAQKPDLILLDINLPIFNGLEVLRQIKNDPDLKMIPVIMLTTSTHKKDIEQAYNYHCNSYVEKPIDIKIFLDTILKIDHFWLQLAISPNTYK